MVFAPRHAGNLNGTDLWEKENSVDMCGHGWEIWQDFRISTGERNMKIMYSVLQNTESIKQLGF